MRAAIAEILKRRRRAMTHTVGEFYRQRTYAVRPTEFKKLTQMKLNSPTVSGLSKSHHRFAARGSQIYR
jgi:hypothetical protein